ncbi:hypothetical protein FGB62_5g246 [Gracilaria domingensis]|nr:hypothetical protein FGB62_5g246 [Gracilaria domingensis]
MGSSAVEWNRDLLTRLLHALVLSRGSLTLAAALLPDLSTAAIRKALRQISLAHRNPSSWSDAKHTTFVLDRVANHSMPPATPPPAAPPSSTASKRVVLQLVPATARDAAIVQTARHHPFLELKLRPRRPLWDVYAHVYTKWALPIRLLTLNHLSIHTSVSSILPQGSALVRLQYHVINVPVDFSALSCILSSDNQQHAPIQPLLTTDTDDQFWTENTASHLPVLDFGSDSLFNISSTHIDSHPPPPEPCPRLIKKHRVVAPLTLHPRHHPQKKKPSRARTRPAPPFNKSIAPLPSASPTIRKAQNRGEKAVLNLLRSHLEQLGSKSSEPTGTPNVCMPMQGSSVGADTNNLNLSLLAEADSMFSMGLSTPLQQPAITNGVHEDDHDTAGNAQLANESLSLIVRDELAVDLNHVTHFDAQQSEAPEAEPTTLLPAPDASLNFSALFQDL